MCFCKPRKARIVKIVIVDQRDGKPQVRWGAALSLACMLGVFASVVAVGVYFALTQTFSPVAAMIGFAGPFITVGSGIAGAIKQLQQSTG
jgi:hypothetical protein